MDVKEKQFEIIQQYNPAPDDYHTWVRSASDILTYDEALKAYSDENEDGDIAPDYSVEDAKRCITDDEMTVYSSAQIWLGSFVTPSQTEAESYAGSRKVYTKNVSPEDVAWLDVLQGQYTGYVDTVMTSDEIEEKLEEEDYHITDNPAEAIYIFPDGKVWSGDFDSGVRGTDHRAIECLFDDIDRYDDDFWEQVFKRTEAIMVMPENNQVTYPEWLTPTKEQQEVLNQLGYERVQF